MPSKLAQKKCIPCEGGVKPLSKDESEKYLKEVGENWRILDESKIESIHTFKDFKEAMQFVNGVANLAEDEGHHPDISIHYNKVTLVLWTHAIGGLHENDFILAAKINELNN